MFWRTVVQTGLSLEAAVSWQKSRKDDLFCVMAQQMGAAQTGWQLQGQAAMSRTSPLIGTGDNGVQVNINATQTVRTADMRGL